jgi:hypothetical protein
LILVALACGAAQAQHGPMAAWFHAADAAAPVVDNPVYWADMVSWYKLDTDANDYGPSASHHGAATNVGFSGEAATNIGLAWIILPREGVRAFNATYALMGRRNVAVAYPTALSIYTNNSTTAGQYIAGGAAGATPYSDAPGAQWAITGSGYSWGLTNVFVAILSATTNNVRYYVATNRNDTLYQVGADTSADVTFNPEGGNIGRWGNGTGYRWDGDVFAVRIYGRALTSGECVQVYNDMLTRGN